MIDYETVIIYGHFVDILYFSYILAPCLDGVLEFVRNYYFVKIDKIIECK